MISKFNRLIYKTDLSFEFHLQTDYAKGFGGKFGVQSDRVDKTAHTYEEEPEKVGTNYEKTRPEGKTINKFLQYTSTIIDSNLL